MIQISKKVRSYVNAKTEISVFVLNAMEMNQLILLAWITTFLIAFLS